MQRRSAQSGVQKRDAGRCPAWTWAAAALAGVLLARRRGQRERLLAAGVGVAVWRLICAPKPGSHPVQTDAVVPDSEAVDAGSRVSDEIGLKSPGVLTEDLPSPAQMNSLVAPATPTLLDLDPVPSLVPPQEGGEPPMGDQILGSGPGLTREEYDWAPVDSAAPSWLATGSTIPDTVELPEIPESGADGADASVSQLQG